MGDAAIGTSDPIAPGASCGLGERRGRRVGGLTVAFCRQYGVGVIVRGVRNGSDLRHEYQLAAMNEVMGITTLLLPARPELAAVSSTALRGLGV